MSAESIRLKVDGMDCGSCALTIEDGLRELPGVQSVRVDFTTETLELVGSVRKEAIEQRLSRLGYRLRAANADGVAVAAVPIVEARGFAGFCRFLWSQSRLRAATIAAAVAIVATILSLADPSTLPPRGLSFIYAAIVLITGTPVFIKGFRALLFSRRITIDLLMAIATLGALAIDAGGEAVTVILLYTLGEALEAYSAERARNSLRSLLALQPQTATILRPHTGDHGHDHGKSHDREKDHDHGHAEAAHAHGPSCGHDHDHGHEHKPGHDHAHDHDHDHDHGHDHGHDRAPRAAAKAAPAVAAKAEVHYHAESVPVSAIRAGDRLLVRPGERIPVDAVVLGGESSVNEAAVTGESIPVAKGAGAAVLGGTVNGEGALELEASRVAGESTVARIARLVEQAQAERSPVQRFIDRFARWYTPAVVLLAVVLVLIPVYAFGQPLLDPPDGGHGWLYRGLALLIVACPCALVISIPVTVVSSLTRLAQLGVLVKGGERLDSLADVRAVAFDKTGTLTKGRPSVTGVQGRHCAHEAEQADDCVACDDVIGLAASVEVASEHPISHAIREAASSRGVLSRYPQAQGVKAVAGRGIVGELSGTRIAVGSDALFAEGGEALAASGPGFADSLRASSRTVMLVARDTELVGAIGVEDPLRPNTAEALAQLQQSSPGVRTVMLTGDNERVAQRIARETGGIDEVRANLLPAGKMEEIERLKREYGGVAMVGDGINDAPALARADVGIAMGGSGTAQAMESADVVLMQDDLGRLPRTLVIARKTRELVKQNIALSLGLKLAFLALTIPGWATLWLAVAADVGATLLVTLNGMRMLRS